MGIPLPPSPIHTASQSMALARETEIDFEQDAALIKMLEKKRRLEDAEIYNSPETMQKKRKAVREQAQAIPKRSPSTDLHFDDNMDSSPAESQAGDPAEQNTKSELKTTKPKISHRTSRRSRVAARRREAKAQNTDADKSPEQLALTTRRGRKRLRRLKEEKADKEQLSTQLEA